MKVWNKRDPLVPKDAVYVGRPTKFGNPFTINKHQTREQAIELYKRWIYDPPRDWLWTAAKAELKGKDLVCWCAPLPCHADILLEIANEDSLL